MQILNRMKSSGPSSTVPRPAASVATGTSKCGFPNPESETVRWGCGAYVTRVSSSWVSNVRPQQTHANQVLSPPSTIGPGADAPPSGDTVIFFLNSSPPAPGH